MRKCIGCCICSVLWWRTASIRIIHRTSMSHEMHSLYGKSVSNQRLVKWLLPDIPNCLESFTISSLVGIRTKKIEDRHIQFEQIYEKAWICQSIQYFTWCINKCSMKSWPVHHPYQPCHEGLEVLPFNVTFDAVAPVLLHYADVGPFQDGPESLELGKRWVGVNLDIKLICSPSPTKMLE